MTKHPITPPPELLEQWRVKWSAVCGPFAVYLATQAVQWGADQQLEQCVAWLDGYEREGWAAEQMRSDCRPKPPSLKEQALLAIDTAVADDRLSADVADVVRRALESLND